MFLGGREADSVQTLTGRLPLWELSSTYVWQRPVFGYGFDSFWTPDRIRFFSAQLQWAVPHSHNGFIELALDLGGAGLIIYLIQFARTWLLLRRAYKVRLDPVLRFYTALFLFYFLAMFTEAIAFDAGLPSFCILCVFWSRDQFPLRTGRSLSPTRLRLASRFTEASCSH
jgi:O-antigen ligase